MSNDNTVSVMDQLANATAISAGNVVQTALEHAREAVNVADMNKNSTAKLTEKALTGMLILRAKDAQDAISAALIDAIGLELPSTLQSSSNDKYCIRWMSPDEWLLSCSNEETFSLEQSLRSAVSGHIAIVNVTGGYSVLILSGEDARNILRKSTVYDVNPENLPSGKVVNTTCAKAQITLMALESDAFEIIVRRSFADYLWLWLQRAGSEYHLQLDMLDQ